MAHFDGITTRAGDDGSSSLPGAQNLAKDDSLFDFLGDLDELTAALGLARSTAGAGALPGGAAAADIARRVERMQIVVGRLAAAVARRTADSAIDPEAADVTEIEEAQADLLRRVRLPRSFVLPGANRLSAEIHLARTVCRRAERSCVSAVRGHGEAGFETFVPVLNRLSDYLFVLALVADPEAGPTEMA